MGVLFHSDTTNAQSSSKQAPRCEQPFFSFFAESPTQRPHEAIWAPIDDRGVRLRLAELAGLPIAQEPAQRIAETQAYRRWGVETWQQL
jgi:hypothetical protein